MRKMVGMVGQDLKWIKPDVIKKEYVLLGKKSVIAVLSFQNPFSFFATAESADGKWIFKRVGIWKPKVTIREIRSEVDLGVFKNITREGEGTLELTDGTQYNLRNHTDAVPSHFSFECASGEALISYGRFDWFLSLSSHVEIHPIAKDVSEMPWMVLLGWYAIILPNGRFEFSIEIR